MTEAQRLYIAQKPDFRDTRDGSHLLVWGGLAQWLVVDDELAAFLERFDGKRSVDDVLRLQAEAYGKPLAHVERETAGVIDELLGRGILHEGGATPAVQPEAVRIANVTVNLTNRCNLRCPWCYNAARDTEEMPVQDMMDAIEAGRAILDPNASFIILGGEPFLDPPRLLAAVDRAGALFQPATLVSTNGTLLTAEMVGELARRRVEVQVSLDSGDPTEHDAVRGEGVFERAVAGIGRLVEAGVYTIVSMVYTRDNGAAIEGFLDRAVELGVSEARLIPMRAIGGGLEHRDSLPDQRAVFERLLEILERRPEFRTLLGRDFFSILATVCRHSTPRTGCGIGRKVVFIDADGSVYPCPNHVDGRHQCGDLKESRLDDIIENSPALAACRERYRVTCYTRCQACPFRYWCAGDCRGEVVAMTGDAAAPSPHCEELQYVIKEMLWLSARSDERLRIQQLSQNPQAATDTFLT